MYGEEQERRNPRTADEMVATLRSVRRERRARTEQVVEKSDQIDLTGNPFVDSGLAVIAALAKLDDVRDLTWSHIRQVHGDGTWLASQNAKLNSYSQIFGTNNPLFQKGYGYSKGKGPGPVNLQIYRNTLAYFIDGAVSRSGRQPCEACGSTSSVDFGSVCSTVIEAAGKAAPADKSVGRDWFPLVGSLGSDAQALPGASRAVTLCGICLFAVHYLPMGVLLFDGLPTVFQSNATDFWYAIIRDIVDETQSRAHAGEFAALGAKEGTRALVRRLLYLFETNPREPKGVSLFAWRFSNSGASPQCEVLEIPNPALEFLAKCAQKELKPDIERCISAETDSRWSLLRCVTSRQDYPGLYARKKWPGVSSRLYALYQHDVCGFSRKCLGFARRIADGIKARLRPAELARVARADPRTDASLLRLARPIIVKIIEAGDAGYEDY